MLRKLLSAGDSFLSVANQLHTGAWTNPFVRPSMCLMRNTMKINHWTMGLAAVGLVTLPGLARAEEQGIQLWTAVSSTTLSGYINTSMHWNPGTGNGNVPYYFYNTSQKQDGFNLNVVDLTLERALDEAQWSAGYKVQLWFGPDASSFGSTIAAIVTFRKTACSWDSGRRHGFRSQASRRKRRP